MQAITVRDRDAGAEGLTLADPPYPHAAENDVIVLGRVEPDRAQLAQLAQRVRDGRLAPIVGEVRPLAEAADAFARRRRTAGKTIISVAGEER